MLPILQEDYKTVEGINAQLKAHPQVWTMSKTTTAAGNPWIFTEVIDELEVEQEEENGAGKVDGKTDDSDGAE